MNDRLTWDKAPSPDPAADERTGLDLRAHLRILRQRWWWSVALGVLVGALAFVYASRQAPTYAASTTFIIDSAPPKFLGKDVDEVVQLGAGDYWSNKEFYETQYKVLASREVLSRAVAKLDLANDHNFLGTSELSPEEAEKWATALIEQSVRIEPVRDSQIARVIVEDGDPARAAQLSNAVVEAYVESNIDRKLEGTHAASRWLGTQLETLKNQLEESELALHYFRQEKDILSTSLEDRQNIVSQRLIALNEKQTSLMAQRAELSGAVREVERVREERKGDPFWALALSSVAADPVVVAIRNELTKGESELAALQQRYLERHPERLAAEKRLETLRTQLIQELERAASRTTSRFREIVSTQNEIRGMLESVKAETFELNKKAIDYSKLKREEENYESLYARVMTRAKEADLTGLLRSSNVRILDAAQPPAAPIRPRPVLFAFLGMLCGAGLGIVAAYGHEFLDRSLKDQADVERTLGVPFLGLVPKISLAGISTSNREEDPSRDLYVFQNPKSAAAECCRSIRTNLLFISPEKPLDRLVVTSAGPQEGKTTTSVNIGITMAQNGARVLLIDTDMRRPRLHQSFRISHHSGLSTALLGEAPVEQLVRSTDVPNLFVLPCGPVPPNPSELLHTERFRSLVEELSRSYDRLIFDTPPVAVVADAAVLATLADGVLLVTRQGKTNRDVAGRALRTLRGVNSRILGVVLNDVNIDDRNSSYYDYRRLGGYYAEDSGGAEA